MTTKRTTFCIDELDCAQEALQLRRQLEASPGIERLDFDLLHRRMLVSFDAHATSPAAIIEQVSKTGMQARLWGGAAGDTRTRWQRFGRPAMTSAAGGLLIAAFVAHALLSRNSVAASGYGAEGAATVVPLASRLLYGVSIVLAVWFVAPRAWSSLWRLRADMNLLMCVAVAGAILLGQWLEAAVVSFLFSVALLLEHWSIGRARRAIATLMGRSPSTARCLTGGGAIEERDVADVELGEIVVVRPGEKIPLDGVLRDGASSVDQGPITGESQPVMKQPGDEVFAGTINGEGALQFQVTRPAGDTTLARIIHMVEEAQARRAPAEQWVERFARYYTPTIMALAIVIAFIPPLLFSALWSDWVYKALVLLVIACPCALVISTPVSIVSALTAAARHGVLIKGGRFLEAAADLRAVAIDKTGTLTHGRPEVHEVVPFDGHSRRELLQRAASMELCSTHPIARAILRCARAEGIEAEAVENYRNLAGEGAEATIRGRTFWIGSHRLLSRHAADSGLAAGTAARLQDAGHSVVAVGNAEHVCGLISVADSLRPQAPAAIRAIRDLGVRPIRMLTGDNEPTARAVAEAVGVDDYAAESLPEDKRREVELLRCQYARVAMIGDGVNDAPALAASTLGIAMGAIGTDAAIETADIALMSDDLAKVPWLIVHARRTLAIVKQNIAVALGLKLLFVVLAVAGAASLWMAIAADMGASLLVIFNGMRLLKA